MGRNCYRYVNFINLPFSLFSCFYRRIKIYSVFFIGTKNFFTSTFKPSAISNRVENIKFSLPFSIRLILERSPANLSANSCCVKPAFFLYALIFEPTRLNIFSCFSNFIKIFCWTIATFIFYYYICYQLFIATNRSGF